MQSACIIPVLSEVCSVLKHTDKLQHDNEHKKNECLEVSIQRLYWRKTAVCHLEYVRVWEKELLVPENELNQEVKDNKKIKKSNIWLLSTAVFTMGCYDN